MIVSEKEKRMANDATAKLRKDIENVLKEWWELWGDELGSICLLAAAQVVLIDALKQIMAAVERKNPGLAVTMKQRATTDLQKKLKVPT